MMIGLPIVQSVMTSISTSGIIHLFINTGVVSTSHTWDGSAFMVITLLDVFRSFERLPLVMISLINLDIA
jgi:hypothetical protein